MLPEQGKMKTFVLWMTLLSVLVTSVELQAAPRLDLSQFADESFFVVIMDRETEFFDLMPGHNAKFADGTPVGKEFRGTSRGMAHTEVLYPHLESGKIKKPMAGGFFVRDGKPVLTALDGTPVHNAYLSRGVNGWQFAPDHIPNIDVNPEYTIYAMLPGKYRKLLHETLAIQFNTEIFAPDIEHAEGGWVGEEWGVRLREIGYDAPGKVYHGTYKPTKWLKFRHFARASGYKAKRAMISVAEGIKRVPFGRFATLTGAGFLVDMVIYNSVMWATGNEAVAQFSTLIGGVVATAAVEHWVFGTSWMAAFGTTTVWAGTGKFALLTGTTVAGIASVVVAFIPAFISAFIIRGGIYNRINDPNFNGFTAFERDAWGGHNTPKSTLEWRYWKDFTVGYFGRALPYAWGISNPY